MSRKHARIKTAYDASSLRLHQDGTLATDRVTDKRTIRDARGNWIARDAGGDHRVKRVTQRKTGKRYGRIKSSEPEPGDNELEFIDLDLEEERKSDLDGVSDGITHPKKRRKVPQDLDFISEQSSANLPSSDFLKCIHHFASTYYAERGMLLDGSKVYREEKRQRMERRRRTQSGSCSGSLSRSRSHSRAQSEEGGAGVKSDAGDTLGTNSEDDYLDNGKGARAAHLETWKKSISSKKYLTQDMYKAMDGSALMAIGMLLQERVTTLLTPRMPEGWAEMIAQADKERDWQTDLESAIEDEAASSHGIRDGVDEDDTDEKQGTRRASERDEKRQNVGQVGTDGDYSGEDSERRGQDVNEESSDTEDLYLSEKEGTQTDSET